MRSPDHFSLGNPGQSGPPDSPNRSSARILCLSNGHGEDQIAVRVLEALRSQTPTLEFAALPLVGQGQAYAKAGIHRIGPSHALPSGGFLYMDSKQLVKDVRGGLLGLTWRQWQALQIWKTEGNGETASDLLLAVGDVVPLLFAWLSGAPYAFIGTARSEYYLRDEGGPLTRASRAGRRESQAKSVFHPVDRWLMSRPLCRAVFPRDRLTTQILKAWPIPAQDLGNPMMDGLTAQFPVPAKIQQDMLKVLLLPGSRSPEAYRNWELMLEAVKLMVGSYRNRTLAFLAAASPELDLQALLQPAQIQGWRLLHQTEIDRRLKDWLPQGSIALQRRQHLLLLSAHRFADYAQATDVAIAMAGTATEQVVGLGKPAFILPGEGPQFTSAFAEAQTRLLGPSVVWVDKPSQMPEKMQSVLGDPERLRLIAENGRRRMGEAGAAERIATHLCSVLASQ